MESGNDTAVSQASGTTKEKRLRKRPGQYLKDKSDSDTERATNTKRGRGRPPKTSEHGSIVKNLKASEAERENKEVTQKTRQPRMSGLSEYSDYSDAMEDVRTSVLGVTIAESLADITKVVKTSKNISVSHSKTLSKAMSSIQEACSRLLQRSNSEEIRALETVNTRLSKELSEVKAELTELKRELINARPQISETQTALGVQKLNVEELLQRAVQEAISISSARLDALALPGWKKKRGNTEEEEVKTGGVTKERKKTKLRSPNTSAVVLTLQPEAEKRGVTYKSVLEEAKKRIDLAALNISAVRYRLAITGARIYEVSGDANKDKADALAGKLREVLGEDCVRISRPQKCVELRITDLDDSTTETEIAEAVARSGNCLASDVKIGTIRRNWNGRGSVWLKCPVDAAKKITASNTRLCVGWTVVRVTLLPARTMRCYRCQEAGHTRTKCSCEIDRTGFCFRCGQPGHPSTMCQNAPHCALCESRGKPADHRVGSSTCGKSAPKKSGSNKSNEPQKPAEKSAVASDVEVADMETF